MVAKPTTRLWIPKEIVFSLSANTRIVEVRPPGVVVPPGWQRQERLRKKLKETTK